MIRRWASKVRMMTQNIPRITAAATLLHPASSLVRKLDIVAVTVWTVLPVSSTAKRHSFHALLKAKTGVTAIPH